jgi:YVTN family beta-propeller protein
VTCYGDNTLYALDAATLTVVDVVHDVGRGPTDLVVDEARGRAYVTLFSADTVAVVALDRPDHIGLEVVARLGRPRPEPEESFSLDPFQWF